MVETNRLIDDDLRREWAVPLGSFEVLAAVRELGGRARPQEIADVMRIPPSSLSRRLDRLEEEGWIERHRRGSAGDRRLVDVEVTRRGQVLWREMNRSYRRSVQARFAGRLDDVDVDAVAALLARFGSEPGSPGSDEF